MLVRSATTADFPAVASLLAELGRPEAAADEAARRGFEADVEDPAADHLLAVADDGHALGFCSLHYRSRLNHATAEAWIPDLIVTLRARGTGAGRALLQEAERRARDRGCHRLALESGYERTRAHGVYEAAGMAAGGKFFTKELG